MLPRIHPDRMQIAFDDHCAPASSLFYWNRAWPVRLPLPISPCVNARAHRFGGFGFRFRFPTPLILSVGYADGGLRHFRGFVRILQTW